MQKELSTDSFLGPKGYTISLSLLHVFALSLPLSPFFQLSHLVYGGESYVSLSQDQDLV